MDYLVLETVINDLKPRLINARIDKVFQPGRDRLLFRIWNGRENLRLVMDVSPGEGRIYLTHGNEPNPQRPPRFCQLLRARVKRIKDIELKPMERIIEIELQGEGEVTSRLMVEMLGVDGNMALVANSGRIIDALHRNIDSDRPLTAGTEYHLPERPQRRPLSSITTEDLATNESLVTALLEQVEPMTPLLAQAIAASVEKNSLDRVLKQVVEEVGAEDRGLCIGLYRQKPTLSVLPLTHTLLKDSHCHDDLHQGLASYYGDQRAVSSVSPKDVLLKSVNRGLKRLKKRLHEIDRDEEKARRSDEFQRYGELLLANLHALQRGMECITLQDWYEEDQPAVTIPLDPQKNPQENAELYFHRSKKLQRGQTHRERRRRETDDEITWLKQVALSLDEAASSDEIQQIREELEQGGLLRKPTVRRSKAPLKADGLKRANSASGLSLIWGTNNRQNDLLLREVAKPDDLWFHAHDLPGSHLILQTAGKEVTEEDRRYAASVAAGFSRGKNDQLVEVKLARVKDLRRVKGGRPGFVLVDRFTTLRVAPLRP